MWIPVKQNSTVRNAILWQRHLFRESEVLNRKETNKTEMKNNSLMMRLIQVLYKNGKNFAGFFGFLDLGVIFGTPFLAGRLSTWLDLWCGRGRGGLITII